MVLEIACGSVIASEARQSLLGYVVPRADCLGTGMPGSAEKWHSSQ
jgi:hypothetical protein